MSGPSGPLVSVITPVYNGGKYLRECIESVIAQSHANWRYTIVNNCSSDDSLEIARHYAQRDARMRVHNNAAFLPIIDNHNQAFSLIDPESVYCKPVMADDWLYPECLEKMVSCALAQPSIGLVCSWALTGRELTGSNRILFDCLPRANSSTTILTGRTACRICLLEDCYFFGSPTTMLIRADLVRKRMPFYDPLNLHADGQSCYDILQESDCGFLHQALAFIREHHQSQTSMAMRLESMIAGRFYALTKYGPVYLSDEELERRSRERLREYYAKLAVAAVELRDKKFWEFHRRMLTLAGAPLDRLRLTSAIAAHVARRLTSPASLARSAGNRVRSVLGKALGRKRPHLTPGVTAETFQDGQSQSEGSDAPSVRRE